MKEFLLSILPEGSIFAVDVSGAGREARFYPQRTSIRNVERCSEVLP